MFVLKGGRCLWSLFAWTVTFVKYEPIRAIPHAQLERLRETASVRVCSWNCSCPICSRSAIIEIELDLALGTAKSENILK